MHQLSMRTHHIGGPAAAAARNENLFGSADDLEIAPNSTEPIVRLLTSKLYKALKGIGSEYFHIFNLDAPLFGLAFGRPNNQP